MSGKHLFTLFLLIFVFSLDVFAAGTMKGIVCNIISPVYDTLKAAGPALVLLMFTYGAVKYAMSADDPGGRKQAKNIIIHAVIAGLIFGILIWIATSVLNLGSMISGCITP